MTETDDITYREAAVELDDNVIRLIGIPFFGVFIPNITGLFGDLSFHSITYWLGYVYFIMLAALIWQGNRFLLFRTRKRFTWFDKPMEKLVLLFFNNIFYTSPLTIAWLCLWYRWAGFPAANWSAIQMVTLINVICVLFVTHVYETVFMLKEQQGERLKNAQLSQAKAEAELSALKNQVDPHFMFNSLNTLSYLITADPAKALQFTENLADVYRYILSQKEQALVPLEDELEFTTKYTDLLHLRFGNALIIKNNLSPEEKEGFLIPPTSVFVAFENAVKHNEISEQMPLHIDMDIRAGDLYIVNSIQRKGTNQHSSKIGLKNLGARFRIVTGKEIFTTIDSNIFIVKLPLIPFNSQ